MMGTVLDNAVVAPAGRMDAGGVNELFARIALLLLERGIDGRGCAGSELGLRLNTRSRAGGVWQPTGAASNCCVNRGDQDAEWELAELRRRRAGSTMNGSFRQCGQPLVARPPPSPGSH